MRWTDSYYLLRVSSTADVVTRAPATGMLSIFSFPLVFWGDEGAKSSSNPPLSLSDSDSSPSNSEMGGNSALKASSDLVADTSLDFSVEGLFKSANAESKAEPPVLLSDFDVRLGNAGWYYVTKGSI